MKTYCFWTDLNPAVELALRMDQVDVEYVDVRGPGAYLEAMRRLWRAGESFIALEHDVVPWPGALRALEACPEPLCLYEYPMALGMLGWGGCTKYSAALIRNWPKALDVEFHWRNVQEHLINDGFEPAHVHTPPVTHLNPLRAKPWGTGVGHGRLDYERSKSGSDAGNRSE